MNALKIAAVVGAAVGAPAAFVGVVVVAFRWTQYVFIGLAITILVVIGLTAAAWVASMVWPDA
jgi:hypothetical protein